MLRALSTYCYLLLVDTLHKSWEARHLSMCTDISVRRLPTYALLAPDLLSPSIKILHASALLRSF